MPLTNPYPTFSSQRDEGSVLLSFDGKMMKLNSVGTLIWEILHTNQEGPGLTEVEFLRLLTNRFKRSLPNSIPGETVLQDLKQFLFVLAERRLISFNSDGTGTSFYRVAKDVVWSGKGDRERSLIRETVVEKTDCRHATHGRLLTLRALLWLFVYSFLLRTRGFPHIRRIVESARPKSKKTCDKNCERGICRQVCRAVDRAQTYLLRQAQCLQRSIVITRLLRAWNINAETVIAAHLMPFKSHAWVELDGEVVSDSPNVQRYYDVVIERVGPPQFR